MALPPTPALQSSNHPTTFTCNHHLMLCKSSNNSIFIPQNLIQFPTRRRIAITTALATVFLAGEAISNTNMATSFDLRMTVPDQTLEEAEAGIRGHARELLEIKPLIDSESWGDTQKALRERSPYVRQDLYTIIQGKPGSLRPQLRKLYSKLFNSVTRLDYAARSKDANMVQECYNNIVSTLDDIFAMI
ncbi:psbQ-like protein 3, chloroplastic [Cinnamomum micranthum f. kanehirae]|uniref:PsbQ-like protein 3, chloroplastic n=1 Tax=Cinnamomum micranthum f. kanehirae TaxID=337451 RepID=A0A443PI85_9MAGN|nr:psbQ-like protein 3, chloroplastic [Cinnamomum micranthum f. kanehirae]